MSTTATNLKHVRILLGYTQKAFAARLGVAQSTLSGVERQNRALSDKLLTTTQFVTGMTRDFFDEDIDYYGQNDLLFRTARLGRPDAEKIATAFSITEHYLNHRYPDLVSDVPALDVPDGPLDAPVLEAAAARAREHFELEPDTAIGNITAVLHLHNILVTELPESVISGTNFDGVSTPSAAPLRVIALNRQRSGDRYRFSLAHELAHLILHASTSRSDLTAMETEANMFAASFLMPRRLMTPAITPESTLADYAALKSQWGYSIQAIVRRAHELELIDYQRYRSLRMQISGRGWRVHEPVDVLLENSYIDPVTVTRPDRQDTDTANDELASVTPLATPRHE
ncbi:XRE family transcriptional regulator [Corynebacterium frankenforstense]|uniref:helix-turn-helix domain-containing protein n=1 Tax=Corynebacterium TaxID=1716 RepID=UPI00254FCFB1|nr:MULTISPECIES: XRE family transcriptional regulator [Corynebacterium]MDK6259255.1 XRE family transcriptional regulator [Corynebacterium frankenforstense]MDK8894477.1 XRE family transcriptional regulator [Corynebacterium sp. MSK006]